MKKKFVPIEEVIAFETGHKLADAKLETLNRARLYALCYMVQASHWLDEINETARQTEQARITAEKLLRRRECTLEKADRAFWAYLEKEESK